MCVCVCVCALLDCLLHGGRGWEEGNGGSTYKERCTSGVFEVDMMQLF